MRKIIILAMLMLILMLNYALAHGNIIYDANLDFDKEFKQKTTSAAKYFLEIDEEPFQFDFDKELINVKFDRELEYSVLINPFDYSVSGFRDDSLFSRNSEIKYDKDARKEIALEIFNKIPKEYSSKLIYGGEKKLYSKSYKLTWFRYYNDMYVSGDHLEVEVDPIDGDVIAWRLSAFFYPDSQLETVPALRFRTAEKIAQLKMKAEPLDYDPVLIIYQAKPIWITKVKSLYPIFVAIDAIDGQLVYTGSIRDEMPKDYDYGREVEIIETNFIKDITDVHKTI